MSTPNMRKSVLESFKLLHRTRLKVFAGDEKALIAGRIKINEEYKKNKHVENIQAIQELIKFSKEVELELRTRVIQAKEVKPGVFEAKITSDTLKLENIQYNDAAVPEEGIKRQKPCCKKE